MRIAAAIVLLPLAAAPAFAQAAAGTTRGAEGTTTDGKPAPDGVQGEGRQSATQGSKMVKQGRQGAQAPEGAGSAQKP